MAELSEKQVKKALGSIGSRSHTDPGVQEAAKAVITRSTSNTSGNVETTQTKTRTIARPRSSGSSRDTQPTEVVTRAELELLNA